VVAGSALLNVSHDSHHLESSQHCYLRRLCYAVNIDAEVRDGLLMHVQAQRLLDTTNWRRAECAQGSSTLYWQPQTAQMRFPDFDKGRRSRSTSASLIGVRTRVHNEDIG